MGFIERTSRDGLPSPWMCHHLSTHEPTRNATDGPPENRRSRGRSPPRRRRHPADADRRLTTSTGTQRSRICAGVIGRSQLDLITFALVRSAAWASTATRIDRRLDERIRAERATECGLSVVCRPQTTPVTRGRKPPMTCTFTSVGWGRFELPTSASRTLSSQTTADVSKRTWQVSADIWT